MSFPIRPFGEDEFGAFADVLNEAFGWAPTPKELERWKAGTEFDRTLAAFDGDRMVGTAGAYTFQMTVPGGRLPVAGVTTVGVLPSHRRRGILSALMRRQLADVRERGEPVAALYASEAVIYGRFGYGRASDDLSFRIPTHRSSFVRHAPVDPALRLTVVKPAERRADFERLFEAVVDGRPGQYRRNEHFWNGVLADEESDQGGNGPLRALLAEDPGGVRGYALFRVKSKWSDTGIPDGELFLNELYAADPAAYALLWRGVLDRDLVTHVKAPGRPVDDPITQLLADTRQLQARHGDDLWVRVVEVDKALTGRAYSAAVDVVLDVADDVCPWNARRWRLTADPAGAECKPTDEEPDISLPVSSLGGAYLGAGSLAAQLEAGLVAEHAAGAVRRLATAMSWTPKPWAGLVF
ncbi:GNAT family N-acetyltransferase [Thermoactinospora rubra]|uniref:GNAT family N-acetyltransferase n=1 Tax=Thermoactinospora rubra TaxID=1088767 RepID=UPI000A0FFA9C|nr:GNAT family N-acetyltransferase [Thermoactinospora rubra]